MAITYTYEVTVVDEATNSMEVVYTADGYPPQHIGLMIPTEDETLDLVIDTYAPIAYWESLGKARQSVNVGMKNTVAPAVLARTDKEKITDRRLVEEERGIVVNGVAVETNRMAQQMLTSAVLGLSIDPTIQSVDWKTTEGRANLNREQLNDIAKAVRAYVQACFARELDLFDEVDSGTFTESMLDEGWPA